VDSGCLVVQFVGIFHERAGWVLNRTQIAPSARRVVAKMERERCTGRRQIDGGCNQLRKRGRALFAERRANVEAGVATAPKTEVLSVHGPCLGRSCKTRRANRR